MSAARAVTAVVGAALMMATAAGAATLDQGAFRYERALPAAVTSGRVAFEPDSALLAHSRPGLADLRIVDARGRQVPWRRVAPEDASVAPGVVLNRGRQGTAAVALVDLGERRRVYQRIELEIPGSDFVGEVAVSGADRRSGRWTMLSTTRVFDLAGATRARSTTALVPPSDFRFLGLRAEGVPAIAGATAYGELERPRLVRRRHELRATAPAGRSETTLLLDFGVRGVPVSRLELRADTPRYDRPVRVEAGDDASSLAPVASGRVRRAPGELSAAITVDSRSRYLRVRVENGDDAPLRGLRAETFGPSFAVVVEPGQPGPLRALYGAPRIGAPSYEFARLPAQRPDRVLAPAQLPPERANPLFEPPADTRSFLDRHRWLVQLAIALAALVVGVAGLLALRRRA